jgi:hypothetical protein
MLPTTLRRPATAAVVALAATAALATATAHPAHASVSSAPCDTTYQLAKQELRAKVGGRSVLIGKLYVFRTGKDLCAVTTSAGTRFDGQAKFMQVTLTVAGRTETDKGQYSLYAGRIRLHDDGGCFLAHGIVKLAGGASDDVYASCPISRKKPMP